MAWIYLIGKVDTPNVFKIGLTQAKDINTRIKKLQTGNDEELYVSKYFKTDAPFKLERMLHVRFANKRIMNEWFELTDEDYRDFIQTCEKLQGNIDLLTGNPFFKRN